MRKPERLDKFYSELCRIHKQYFPDWRFGQFISNVFSDFNQDPFFYEEDTMLQKVKSYVANIYKIDIKEV